jgi:hypothetical protein
MDLTFSAFRKGVGAAACFGHRCHFHAESLIREKITECCGGLGMESWEERGATGDSLDGERFHGLPFCRIPAGADLDQEIFTAVMHEPPSLVFAVWLKKNPTR